MTKEQAIESLKKAQREMEIDPNLEEVDTLSLMETAIADALEYFTGMRAIG